MKYSISSLILFLSFNVCISQVGIGNSTPEAALDITSNSSGILIPRVALTSITDTTTITNPNGGGIVIGTLIFNNGTSTLTSLGFCYWNGLQWEFLDSRSGDNDWYVEGTSLVATGINQNIYTQGNVAIGTDTPNANLHVSSGNTGNDAVLLIEADTDNTVETANPMIILSQDGDVTNGIIGLEADFNDMAAGSTTNALVIATKIKPFPRSNVQIAPNETVRATFAGNGFVSIGVDDISPNDLLHVVDDQDDTTTIRIDNSNTGGSNPHTSLELWDGSTQKSFFKHFNSTNVLEIGHSEVNGSVNFYSGNGTASTIAMQLDNLGDVKVSNEIEASNFKLSALNTAPASATAPGTTGEIRVTSTHMYVCIAPNTWVRSALTSW